MGVEQVAILAVGFGGLLIGSFLNVVAHRVPRGEAVTTPPSRCPLCDERIGPADNIPVLSWLLLRGRCRHCGEPISIRYPLVEAGTALLFGAAAAIVGFDWTLPAHLWFVAVAVVLTLTDIDHKRIPNRILYPGAVVGTLLLGVGAALESEVPAFLRGLAGGGGYFGLLLLIALAARGGFGFGDVKLAFLLGEFAAFGGWDVLAVAVFVGFFLGGLLAMLLLVMRRAGRKDLLPFGPAMVAGAFVAITVGSRLVDWYLG